MSLLCLIYDLALSHFFFFFNDTATTEIYTLSLHDALPILSSLRLAELCLKSHGPCKVRLCRRMWGGGKAEPYMAQDRKSTRLNSSHGYISYAVFCLKKKKKKAMQQANIPTHHAHSV